MQKTVKYVGTGEKPSFADGTRIRFHFVANRTDVENDDDENFCIDDSRAAGKPMELIFGKVSSGQYFFLDNVNELLIPGHLYSSTELHYSVVIL